MGSAGSVALKDEASKPSDGSDVNTPRGVSAKAEVIRLRKLLSDNYESVSHLMFHRLLESPRRDGPASPCDAPRFGNDDSLLESAVADLDLEDKGVGSPGKRHRLGGMGALPPPKTAARPAAASATADRATRVELEALEAELDAEMARVFGDDDDDDDERKGDFNDCCAPQKAHLRVGELDGDSDDDDFGLEAK